MPFHKVSPRAALTLAAAVSAASVIGACHRKASEAIAEVAPIKPKEPAKISEVDLKAYKPNEAGAVMVIMYHRFDSKLPSNDKVYNRRPDDFRKDLDDLYKRGYRPATVSEFIDNKMDVPAGKTPVVLTFDDSWDTQFKIVTGADGRPHIDPECAIGILETFQKQHPDWKSKGTFFVLPHEGRNPEPFYQPDSAAEKLSYLVKHGYEIQNHTSTHSMMRGMSAEKVQWELGTAKKDIQGILKEAQMDVVAIPYGALPHKEVRKYLEEGKCGNTSYKNKAVVLAAYRPVASAITKIGKKTAVYQIAPFDPSHIERIKPAPEQASLPGTFEYWLKYFDENPGQRYISDGNLEVAAVPVSFKNLVDADQVRKYGQRLQLYSLTGGVGGDLSVETGSASTAGAKSSGGDLSVEPASKPKAR